jgi:hypothetical protein
MTTLSERIAKYEDPYLECRNRRHRYFDVEDDGRRLRKWQNSNTVTRLVQACERCDVIHYEAWNSVTGDILASDMLYPYDYSIKGGNGAGIRKKLRREYLLR